MGNNGFSGSSPCARFFCPLRVKTQSGQSVKCQGVKKEAHIMPVIYLDKHRYLTKEQKKMAEAALNSEINDVMDNIEIFEDALARTFLFGELHLREQALDYMKRRLKRNPDGSFDDELLIRVYKYYSGRSES